MMCLYNVKFGHKPIRNYKIGRFVIFTLYLIILELNREDKNMRSLNVFIIVLCSLNKEVFGCAITYLMFLLPPDVFRTVWSPDQVLNLYTITGNHYNKSRRKVTDTTSPSIKVTWLLRTANCKDKITKLYAAPVSLQVTSSVHYSSKEIWVSGT
jgi:hypothetical protein